MFASTMARICLPTICTSITKFFLVVCWFLLLIEWSSSSVLAVVINEVMANPSGDERVNEWIELFNPGESLVDMGGFVVTDHESSYTIEVGVVIEAGGYLVLGAWSTKLQLANNGDEVVLLRANGVIEDETAYSGAGEYEDYSWARIPNGSGE